jgi:hypothetical protein
VTKSAKMLLAAACAGFLFLGPVGVARHAYAQDAGETDGSTGAWSAPNADNSEQMPAKVKTHPLKIKGCWSGEIEATLEGTGTVTFDFDQNSNRKKLVGKSKFDFEWPADSAFARGPMKGSVNSSGFQFNATVVNAGETCGVSGSGMGDATEMTGTVEFGEDCATIFEDVTFSIAPGCP